MTNWSKTTSLDIKDNKNKGSRLFICYRDILDKSSVMYIVRIAIKKHP
jgi:hypothetical protein